MKGTFHLFELCRLEPVVDDMPVFFSNDQLQAKTAREISKEDSYVVSF